MQVFPDNACRREILNLDVECGFKGCKWVGKLRDLEVSGPLFSLDIKVFVSFH